MNGPTLTRREALEWLSLLLGTTIACKPDTPIVPDAGSPQTPGEPDGGADGGADAGVPPTDTRWSMFETVRAAVRQSPDHLVARAERLVAARDAAAILAFVRDDLATIPPDVRGFARASEVLRFGTRGTLRGGAGTPRDKAELLRELYTRAGFEAQVYEGEVTSAQWRPLMERALAREFRPAIEAAAITGFIDRLGLTRAPRPALIDADGAASDALADSLRQVVGASTPFEGLTAAVNFPLVRVVVDGQPRWANPFVVNAQFGEASTRAPPQTASRPVAPPRVKMELSYSTAAAPFRPIVAVSGEWSLADLIGRQVVARFVPAEPISRWATLPLDAINTWLPVLALQALDLSRSEAAALSFAANAVSARGELITATDTAVTVGDRVVASGPIDPLKVAAVRSLSLSLDPSTFPDVNARIVALDASGASVRGLPASAFELEDDGRRVAATVASTPPAPPRVAVLFDVSSSVPEAFRSTAARRSIAREIATRVTTAIPGAQLRAGAPQDDADPTWAGGFTGSIDAFEAQAGDLRFGGSALWRACAGAAASGADLTVLITDGDATDLATAEASDRLQAGPPIVAVAVGTVVRPMIDAVTKATGGAVTLVTDAAAIAGLVVNFLGTPGATPYAARWRAEVAGPAERTVRVRLTGNARATVEGRYLVPAVAERRPTGRIAGLHLTVEIGGERCVRTLLGAPLEGRPPTDAQLEEARQGMFASHLISFEGGAPTAAHWFDDLLSARLLTRPLVDAAETADATAVLKALKQGLVSIPFELCSLHSPLPGQRVETFEVVARVARLTQVPKPPRAMAFRADLMPFTRFATLAADPAQAFQTTLRRSAYLATVEAALFNQSTRRQLAGAALLRKPFSGLPPEFDTLPALTRAAWDRLLAPLSGASRWDVLVPRSGAPLSAWAINSDTGSVLGLLSDGSGGGTDDLCRALSTITNLMTLISVIGGYAGASFAFGAWITFAKTYVALIVQATIAIDSLRTEEGGADEVPPPSTERLVLDAACDLVVGAIAVDLGGFWGFALGQAAALNDIASIIDENIVQCSSGLSNRYPQSICE